MVEGRLDRCAVR